MGIGDRLVRMRRGGTKRYTSIKGSDRPVRVSDLFVLSVAVLSPPDNDIGGTFLSTILGSLLSTLQYGRPQQTPKGGGLVLVVVGSESLV